MENYNHNEDIIASKAVIEMLALASEYALFIEKIYQYEKEERLPFLQKILTALYLKGLLFPTIQVNDTSFHERFITEEEYELLHLKLANNFEDVNYFSSVNLMEDDIEAKPVAFAECLADIYLDLKEFLLLYEKGTFVAQENAIKACKDDFFLNWGYKITLVLPYLHVLTQNIADNIE